MNKSVAHLWLIPILVSSALHAGSDPSKPNIVVFLADDMGWGGFGDYRLHLEFQLPEDGGKGNSGVFFGPLYELQILDSSKNEGAGLGDCGAIYQIRAPDVNTGLGPGEWQTVDLEYRAAEIGRNGFMTEKGAARVTVRLNGKLIHDDVRLSLRRNKYAAYPEEPTSPIVLQEHGSPVKFRNIWLVEKTPIK